MGAPFVSRAVLPYGSASQSLPLPPRTTVLTRHQVLAASVAVVALSHRRIVKSRTLRRSLKEANGNGFEVQKSDKEWRKQLGIDGFRMLRLKATELPNTGKYNKLFPESGIFRCAGCALPLFSSAAKLQSTSGWPE